MMTVRVKYPDGTIRAVAAEFAGYEIESLGRPTHRAVVRMPRPIPHDGYEFHAVIATSHDYVAVRYSNG